MNNKSPFNRRGVVFGTAGARKIIKATRAHERAVKGKNPPQDGSRNFFPTWNAVVLTTITARAGRVRGHGTVALLADDGTGTHTDVFILDDAGNKRIYPVENAYLTQIDPSAVSTKDRQVVVGTINGLLQVIGGDCPVIS